MVKERKDSGKYDALFDRKPVLEDVSDVICFFGNVEYGMNTFYQNMMTGKRALNYDDVLRYQYRNLYHEASFASSDYICGFYSEYVEEYDAIVVYYGRMDLSNPVASEQREWKDFYVACVCLRDGTVYDSGHSPYYMYQRYDICGNTLYIKGSYQLMLDNNQLFFNPHTTEVCKKLYGDGFGYPYGMENYLTGKGACPYAKISHISDAKCKKEDIAKANRIIGKSVLRDINTDDIMQFFKTKNFKNKIEDYNSVLERSTVCYYKRKLTIGFLQSIKEGESVIRIYHVGADIRGLTMSIDKDALQCSEFARIYWKDGKLQYVKKWFNKWVCNERLAHNFVMLPWKPEDSVGTPFAYLDDYIEYVANSTIKKDLWLNKYNDFWDSYSHSMDFTYNVLSIVESNVLQEIFQSPFENIKKMFAYKLGGENIRDLLYGTFGFYEDYVEIGMTLMETISVPKHMISTLDKILGDYFIEGTNEDTNKKYYIAGTSLRAMKLYFKSAPEYLKSMNAKQYEELCRTYVESRSISKYDGLYIENENSTDAIARLIEMYGPKNAREYIRYVLYTLCCDMKSNCHEKLSKQSPFLWEAKNQYYDYIDMANQLCMNGTIRKPEWKFKTIEEIWKAHDNITPIFNQFTNEEEIKKYEKDFNVQKPNWKKYLYKESEYSIVIPENPFDIINEGFELHHCVKTYLDNIVKGKTDIVFVRQSDNLRKPFYTLEVRNGEIRQCHGFDNCNVSATDGLQEFLERYCKEKEITFEDCDKILAVG